MVKLRKNRRGRLQRRVLHGGPQPQWGGGIPPPPVIRALIYNSAGVTKAMGTHRHGQGGLPPAPTPLKVGKPRGYRLGVLPGLIEWKRLSTISVIEVLFICQRQTDGMSWRKSRRWVIENISMNWPVNTLTLPANGGVGDEAPKSMILYWPACT